jgi:hypothetical protein
MTGHEGRGWVGNFGGFAVNERHARHSWELALVPNRIFSIDPYWGIATRNREYLESKRPRAHNGVGIIGRSM